MKEMCRDFVGSCVDCSFSKFKTNSKANSQNVIELSENIKAREEMLFRDLPEFPNGVDSVVPLNQPPITVNRTETANTTNRGTAARECNKCVMDAVGLAQAYVAYQPDGKTMGLEQSLVCGTAFADLVKPYVAGSNLNRFQ